MRSYKKISFLLYSSLLSLFLLSNTPEYNDFNDSLEITTYNNGHKLYLNTTNNTNIVKKIRDGLEAFNASKTGAKEIYDHCTIFITSETGIIIAGATSDICTNDALGCLCLIHSLWVDEEHRNQKLGTMILHTLIKHVKNKDCPLIQVELCETDTYAKKLFEKLGFITIATIPNPETVTGLERHVLRKNINNYPDNYSQESQLIINNQYTLHIQTEWNELNSGTILNKCESYNSSTCAIINDSPYAIFITSKEKNIIAGAVGHIIEYKTYGTCCILNNLWVDETYRNNGLGTKIINELINYAINQKCILIQLETYEWQAKPFYEKLGFTTIGTVPNPDNFPGQEQYYMRKNICDSTKN